MTTDPEAAIDFYTQVIGWKVQNWKEAESTIDMSYTMWTAAESSIGGVLQLPQEAIETGTPPYWLAYTTVKDVDHTVAKAKQLGATVLKPPFTMETVGRIATLSDPQNAMFAVYTPINSMDVHNESPGMFSWAELYTTDWKSAWNFYSQLFGWKESGSMEMEEGGTYFMFHDAEEKTKGGMCNKTIQMQAPPHWLHYITVSDLDSTLKTVKKWGGKVFNGPMPVPGAGIIAQCQDPQGAAFAVYAKAK